MSLTVEQDAEVADNVSRLNDGRTDFESTEKQTDRQKQDATERITALHSPVVIS